MQPLVNDDELKRLATTWWELRRLWFMSTVEHKAKVPPELLERADQTHMTLGLLKV